MGAIADAFVAYAQPLIDRTDGSEEQLNKAFAISQCCYNLALADNGERERMLDDMRPTLDMDEAEFESFRSSILDPMIRRHKEMFPFLHNGGAILPSFGSGSIWDHEETARPVRKYEGTDAYAPCPCNSGKKYKFCCRMRSR